MARQTTPQELKVDARLRNQMTRAWDLRGMDTFFPFVACYRGISATTGILQALPVDPADLDMLRGLRDFVEKAEGDVGKLGPVIMPKKVQEALFRVLDVFEALS